ncbi:phosphatidylglycerol lysyltransferase domain-containing protein [Isoptericola sp. G70]|uniref:phosphatidylglycerol lysyltransferase domain-containing protein n=1 Tax=Isoptericola sp. G70 TaxID=3376633 RepID=UPI003A7FEE6C
MPTDLDQHVRRYGSFSLAASVDQPGMKVFGDGDGVIAFMEVRSGSRTLRVCLGEPLAPEEAWERLVRRFLGASSGVVFLNVGEQLGKLLTREGMYLNPLGWEALLDLGGGYDLSGPKKQNIRNAVRRATSLGFSVTEVDEDDDAAWAQLHRVSQDWLVRRSAGRPENRLVTRPFMRRNSHQRVFALRHADGRVVHLVTIDAMWREEKVVGYHSNINRGLEDAPKNADYVIHAALVDRLREEGVPVLSLGLCPDLGATPAGRKSNLYTTFAMDLVRRYGTGVYNLEGIERHKAEFRPSSRRPVFVAAQEPWPAADVLGIFRASNLV